MSSLNTPETTSSNPYSQCQFTSVHSLNNNDIDNNTSANKKQGKQLVQGLKEITGSKSTYDFGTEFSADSTRSIQRLTDSVAGIHEGNISLLSTGGDCDKNEFAQGRRSSFNPTPATSKWHKFTDPSKNFSAYSTSDLDQLL